MKIIGLVGGIASGKTTVTEILAAKGARIINTDALGHAAYLPGQPCYQRVVAAFGPSIVSDDQTIDRRAHGAIIFSDATQKKRLEEIVWPEAREKKRRPSLKPRRPSPPPTREANARARAGPNGCHARTS